MSLSLPQGNLLHLHVCQLRSRWTVKFQSRIVDSFASSSTSNLLVRVCEMSQYNRRGKIRDFSTNVQGVDYYENNCLTSKRPSCRPGLRPRA